MKTIHGVCGLCQQPRDLRDSHLLPASVYKLAREQDRSNPNPVIVSERGATSSSKQISAHFLCAECEDRFSSGGETYVVAQCARPDGSFAVRDLLNSLQPLVAESPWSVFDVSAVLGQKVDHFMYFAASVFWRASAKTWSFGGRPKKCIELGPKYQEQFRKYLLGKAQCPESARLFVHVWSDEHVHYTSVVPATYRVNGTFRHKFCIPGILFILFVGGRSVAEHNAGTLNSVGGAFMWLCPWEKDSLFQSFGNMAVKAIRAKSRRPA